MIDIYITSFFRPAFTLETLKKIKERTSPGSYFIHVYDNGSDLETVDQLVQLRKDGVIGNLVLDSRNTGCLYNKLVFHAMTESSSKYYCVSDNDVYPPKLSPDWLSQIIGIMDAHPEIALLAPQLPPQGLQTPYEVHNDVVYAKAVGNTFKIVRREAFPLNCSQVLGKYGDDGQISEMVHEKGYKVAFCRNIYCYHAGQCDNWGYNTQELDKDPRKAGYGPPFVYEIENEENYVPVGKWKMF